MLRVPSLKSRAAEAGRRGGGGGLEPLAHFTAQERDAAVLQRMQAKAVMTKEIDAVLRHARSDGDGSGTTREAASGVRGRCLALMSAIGRVWRRLRCSSTHKSKAAADLAAAIQTGASHTHQTLFGAMASKSNPASKLESTAAAMKGRLQALEARATEERTEAVRLSKAGHRTAALRMLKKAKVTEVSAASTSDAVLAVEQQLDMLAQGELQKQLSSALASSSKAMRKDSKALSRAEKAIDDAQDARDVASDLDTVMAEFASNGVGDLDDDELAAELESMLAPENIDPPTSSSSCAMGASQAPSATPASMPSIDDSDEASQQPFPSVPLTDGRKAPRSARREEKARLLEGVASAV